MVQHKALPRLHVQVGDQALPNRVFGSVGVVEDALHLRLLLLDVLGHIGFKHRQMPAHKAFLAEHVDKPGRILLRIPKN